MTGRRSYVVLTAGGDNGLRVVRHPSSDMFVAQGKAIEEAEKNPGQIFYVAEVQVKYYLPCRPAVEITELVD